MQVSQNLKTQLCLKQAQLKINESFQSACQLKVLNMIIPRKMKSNTQLINICRLNRSKTIFKKTEYLTEQMEKWKIIKCFFQMTRLKKQIINDSPSRKI